MSYSRARKSHKYSLTASAEKEVADDHPSVHIKSIRIRLRRKKSNSRTDDH